MKKCLRLLSITLFFLGFEVFFPVLAEEAIVIDMPDLFKEENITPSKDEIDKWKRSCKSPNSNLKNSYKLAGYAKFLYADMPNFCEKLYKRLSSDPYIGPQPHMYIFGKSFDLKILEPFKNLEDIKFHDIKINSFEALRELRSLERISITGAEVSDISS